MLITFKPLLDAIPSVKGPIQLVAFLFAAVCMALLVRSNPDNLQSLAISSSLSLALIALPLLFQNTIIDRIPKRSRVFFILSILVLFLAALAGLGVWTARNAFAEPAPNQALFDVTLDPNSVQLITKADGKAHLSARLLFKSLQSTKGHGASVIAGMLVVHDETQMKEAGTGQHTDKPCSEVGTCLGAHVFKGLSAHPLLIPAGSDKLEMTFTVNLRQPSSKVRIWWQFFQRESGADLFCSFDLTKQPPVEGLPYLASFQSGTQLKRLDYCYGSSDMVIATI